MQVRKYVRYRLELPVVFSWKDEQGIRQQGKGVARDLSAGGVFLRTRACPPVGVPVQLHALLPRLEPSAPSLRMQAKGRVLRVETRARGRGWQGFAAVSEAFVLREMENVPSFRRALGATG